MTDSRTKKEGAMSDTIEQLQSGIMLLNELELPMDEIDVQMEHCVYISGKQAKECLQAFKDLEELKVKENEQWAMRLIAEAKADRLSKELADFIKSSPEAAKDYLEFVGIDADKAAKEGSEFVKDLLKNTNYIK